MKRSFLIIIVVLLILLSGLTVWAFLQPNTKPTTSITDQPLENDQLESSVESPHALSIEALRQTEIRKQTLTIEETLSPGSNYKRYIASYVSDGFKQYGLLTIPNGTKPATGWPVIIFNHGYVPPRDYRTTERYIAYTDGFSRNGYLLFRPDYRGHGNSEGIAGGGYANNDYTIDVLNALETIKNFPDSDPNRIGMWGHSMGGHITLRSMVVRNDIRAGVIWAGVVASYPDLMYNWRRITPTTTPQVNAARRWRQQLIDEYGTPETNPEFWNSISSTSYLKDISGPIQQHHGTADSSVPYQFAETLDTLLREEQKETELYIYPGDDHNLSQNFQSAMQRSIEFFDRWVKPIAAL